MSASVKHDATQLRVRLPHDLQQCFLDLCRNQDTTASQVIRAYIRTYVREQCSPHAADAQTRG